MGLAPFPGQGNPSPGGEGFPSGYSPLIRQAKASGEATETSSSGDQVSFDLSAYNTCAGAEQTYRATDTVVNGKITAATITQLSGLGAN